MRNKVSILRARFTPNFNYVGEVPNKARRCKDVNVTKNAHRLCNVEEMFRAPSQQVSANSIYWCLDVD